MWVPELLTGKSVLLMVCKPEKIRQKLSHVSKMKQVSSTFSKAWCAVLVGKLLCFHGDTKVTSKSFSTVMRSVIEDIKSPK